MLPLASTAAGCLAFLPEYPTLSESLGFQANGLIVVLLALGSIWGILELIGLYFKRADRQKSASLVSPMVPVAAAPATAGHSSGFPGVAPQTVAAIAAAVHAVLGSGHRITVVKPADSSVDWAREGRRQIFASHKVR